MLDGLQREGRLRAVDTAIATQTIIGMVLWIPKWYKPDGRLSAEQVADEVTGLVMRSVLVGGDGSRGTKPKTARPSPRSQSTPR